MTPGTADDRVDALIDALAEAWQRGERPTAADLLARHPDLDDEAAVRLIFEEVSLRREAGLDARTSEVVARYPRWRSELEPLLGVDRLMRPPQAAAAPLFPESGERLGDFLLRDELGRGAAGRTFLAEQPSLADRPVVLKLLAQDHDEHLSLARLQHTHIVPLYSEQVFPDRNLRGLCMPYLGGANLAQVLAALGPLAPRERVGLDFVAALEGEAGSAGDAGPFRRFLAKATYEQATCWVAACLSDALQYAHDRGLVHMDLKPANVLIAADGQPMLLDFHLARAPVPAGSTPHDRLGGTPGWTSPEQAEAMRAVFEGRPVPQAVDGRSDIYALGLLLVEVLGLPRGPDGAPLAGKSWVSPSLRALALRCLAADPGRRYPTAGAVAEDLRRELNDEPLAGVPDRNPLGRWRKWRRRRPEALTRVGALVTLVGTLALVAAVAYGRYQGRLAEVRGALDAAVAFAAEGRFEDAARAADQGLALARQFSPDETVAALRSEKARSRRMLRALDLHRLADRARYQYGIAPTPSESLRALAPKLLQVWKQRAALLDREGNAGEPEGRPRLDAAARDRVARDLFEVAVVGADLRVRLSSPEGLEEARREALDVLNQVGAELGTSPALRREQLALTQALGLRVPDEATAAPATAWEEYDLGRSYLRSGNDAKAADAFSRALVLRPDTFWPNYYQGACAYRLGRFEEAVAAFRACVTLEPGSAESWVNRALAWKALGRADLAYRDNTRAAEIAPELAAAYLNRGLLSHEAGRDEEAAADFRKALACPGGPADKARAHYDLALALLANGARDEAREQAGLALKLGAAEARALLDSPALRP